MKIFIYISLFVFGFFHTNGICQSGKYSLKAFESYQKKDFTTAKIWIDSAKNSNQLTTDRTYFLRGLIYRELKDIPTTDNRTEALKSFKKATTLSTNASLKKQIKIALYNTISKTHNEAYYYIKNKKLNKSESKYYKFKEQYLKYYDPTKNFDELDIKFFTTLGSAWQDSNEFGSFDDQIRQLDIAVEKYNKVLVIDPNNWTANYAIGVAYYNLGRNLYVYADPLLSLDEIKELQTTALRLFKNGKPFLEKAFELDSKNEHVIRGLRNIHHAMHNSKKEAYFKNLYEEVTGKKLIDNR